MQNNISSSIIKLLGTTYYFTSIDLTARYFNAITLIYRDYF